MSKTFIGADERLDEAYPIYLWNEQKWFTMMTFCDT